MNGSQVNGENVAGGTLAHYIKAVRSMFNSARRQGLILTNPAEAIELPRKRMHERRVLRGAIESLPRLGR